MKGYGDCSRCGTALPNDTYGSHCEDCAVGPPRATSGTLDPSEPNARRLAAGLRGCGSDRRWLTPKPGRDS